MLELSVPVCNQVSLVKVKADPRLTCVWRLILLYLKFFCLFWRLFFQLCVSNFLSFFLEVCCLRFFTFVLMFWPHLRPGTSRTQKTIQAEVRVSAEQYSATHWEGVSSDRWDGLFLYESIHILLMYTLKNILKCQPRLSGVFRPWVMYYFSLIHLRHENNTFDLKYECKQDWVSDNQLVELLIIVVQPAVLLWFSMPYTYLNHIKALPCAETIKGWIK